MKELGRRFLEQWSPFAASLQRKLSVDGRSMFLDPFFGKQRARSVTTADVAELHCSLSHIPCQANRTLGVLSKMMNLAETWGIRDKHTDPCEDVERYPERKREKVPVADGTAASRTGINNFGGWSDRNHIYHCCLPILLLTGCRLSEIQTLEWRHVDLQQKELRLPDSKTGAKTAISAMPQSRCWRRCLIRECYPDG